MQFFNAGGASIFLAPGTTVSPGDDPEILYDGTVTLGTQLGPYDTSKYNSLEIVVSVPAPDDMAIVWQDIAGGTAVDRAQFTAVDGLTTYRTPAKGGGVLVINGTQDGTVIVIASYRSVPDAVYFAGTADTPSQGTIDGNDGDGMVAWSGGNLAHGTAATAPINSAAGPAHLYFNAGPGSSTWNVDVQDVETGATLAGIEGIAGTTAAQCDLMLPARPVKLLVTNTGGTTTAFFTSLVYSVA